MTNQKREGETIMHFEKVRAELCKRREFRPLCLAMLHWVHRHQHLAHDNLHTVYFGLGALKFWHTEGLIAMGLCGVSVGLFVLSVTTIFEVEEA
jgi:hypothetical protein